jgi:glycosyltransferase involved in cell wall biosynthesis
VRGWFGRARITAEDRLRHDAAVRAASARALAYRALRRSDGSAAGEARVIAGLCDAVRAAWPTPYAWTLEERIRERVERLKGRDLDWGSLVPGAAELRLAKAVALKPWISDREKGVVFISFENQWAKLLTLPNVEEFAARYTLVLAPGWSPPHSLVNVLFPARYPGRIHTLISNAEDLETFARIAPNVTPLPLYASSWVDPRLFKPLPRSRRDVDLLMVANFGKFKRHFALFRALQSMPRGLRVTLVGQSQDARDAGSILAEADLYGVRDRFTLLRDVPYERLAELFCRSRATVVLSRREGSCVVVAESLFADAPCALLRGAAIGSRAFLNDQTGVLLDERDLAAELVRFVERVDDFRPREWAESRISCVESSRVLNEALKESALCAGEDWSEDIATLAWAPDPVLPRAADHARVERAYLDLEKRFGLTFGWRPAPEANGCIPYVRSQAREHASITEQECRNKGNQETIIGREASAPRP